MYKLIVFLCLIMSINVVSADNYYPLQTNPHRINRLYRHNNYGYRPVLSSSNLSALEKYALNRTYTREMPLNRLERLEDYAFGAVQEGDLGLRYRNVENAILSRPQTVTKKNILNNIANYFAGQATGYTPPIQYTNPYDYGYSAYPSPMRRQEQITNSMFSEAYNVINQNMGNGSSVRIIPWWYN